MLLVFPGALGDFLLLVPAAAALARRGWRVELSVRRALEPLARRLLPLGPPVDGAAMSSLFTSVAAEPLAAWLHGADAVHLWLGCRGADLALARAPDRFGVGAVHVRSVERGDGPIHASAAYGAALGVEHPLAMPALALADGRADQWRAPPMARLLIHPGAGSAEKRWSRTGFRRVADGWAEHGGEVAILLGPAEEDQRDFWCATDHRCLVDPGITEATALLGGAPRYLGNDSGVSHLAGALGAAGAVLFGPTRPERWRPLGGALAPVIFTGRAEAALATALLARLGEPGRGPGNACV